MKHYETPTRRHQYSRRVQPRAKAKRIKEEVLAYAVILAFILLAGLAG